MYIYKKSEFKNKKYITFSAIFSGIVSMFTVIGTELEYLGDILWTSETLLMLISLTIDIFPMVYFILKYIENKQLVEKEVPIKKLAIMGFLVILFFNFLVWLAVYPGVYAYDSVYQLKRGLTQEMDMHYSVVFCYLLSFFFSMGYKLFRSYQVGCAIFVFLQLLFLTFVTSKVTIYIYKKTKSLVLYVLSIMFYTLFAFYKIMTVSIAQDTLFAAFFALIFIELIEITTNTEEYFKRKTNLIKLIFYIIMLCLLRNNGFYALICVYPFLFFINTNKKRKSVLIASFTIGAILYKVISGPIYTYIGVIKNNDAIKEMSSIPSQQIARAYVEARRYFTDEEIEKLRYYYNDVQGLAYSHKINPQISDLLKNRLNRENVKEDIIGYLSFYIKLGVKIPESYIEAFFMNNLGFYYIGKKYPDSRMFHPLIEFYNSDAEEVSEREKIDYLPIERESKLPILNDALEKLIVENSWQEVPILSMMYNLGFYFMIVLFMIGIIILRKEWKLLLPMSLIIGLYVTLFLAPVALFRYAFPIVILFPLYIMIIFNKSDNIRYEDNKEMIEERN